MSINKKSNDYAQCLNEIYDRMPKAVLAAVAVSFAVQLMGEGSDQERLIVSQDFILNEWELLYSNGIVPQKPVKTRWELKKQAREKRANQQLFNAALAIATKQDKN